ncbi:MAG: hypothetical protein ABFD91_11085, partial [Anaerohalosphaeraceae bacterium]
MKKDPFSTNVAMRYKQYSGLLLLLSLPLMLPRNLSAHENDIVHPGLTNAASRLVEVNEITTHCSFDISEDMQCSFIDEGSVKEDTTITSVESWDGSKWGQSFCELKPLNYIKHGYNPVTGKGWLDLGAIDALEYAEPIWNQAVNEYNLGRRNDALFRLGRICHLLEDMTSPAHVHGDFHPTGDDFEDWGENHFSDYDFSVLRLTPEMPTGRVNLPNGIMVDANSIQGILHSLALFTYKMCSFEGHLQEIAGIQPDSELSRMFPTLHYYDGGILGDNYWEIDDIGGLEQWGSDEWWACNMDHIEYEDREGVRHIKGHFYIENAAGYSGNLTPAVFEKSG